MVYKPDYHGSFSYVQNAGFLGSADAFVTSFFNVAAIICNWLTYCVSDRGSRLVGVTACFFPALFERGQLNKRSGRHQ